MNFLSIFLCFFTAAEYKAYWVLTAKNPPGNKFLTNVGSVAAIFNGMRFIWSALLDKFPYKVVYGTLLVIEIIIGFTIPFVVDYKWLYAIWVCLAYLCLGGHFTLVPNELKQLFGPKTTQLYAYMYTYAGIAGVVDSMLCIFIM